MMRCSLMEEKIVEIDLRCPKCGGNVTISESEYDKDYWLCSNCENECAVRIGYKTSGYEIELAESDVADKEKSIGGKYMIVWGENGYEIVEGKGKKFLVCGGVHRVLLNAKTDGWYRHTELDTNYHGSSALQSALMYGLVESDKPPDRVSKKYRITPVGKLAREILNAEAVTCPRVVNKTKPGGKIEIEICSRCYGKRKYVEVPTNPNMEWVKWFETRRW